MNKDKLKEVAGELEKASKMHAGQAKKIKSMLKYKKSSGFKMYGKSPLMKKLIGKQHNLPEHLKEKIAYEAQSLNMLKDKTAKLPI